MIVTCAFILLLALSGSAGVFFLARGMRKKLNAPRYTLQDARAQGTMFLLSPMQDPETAPHANLVRYRLDMGDLRGVRRAGRHYRAYQALLRCQAQFESWNTIELPAFPRETAGNTEPIRMSRLDCDTEGIRSVFPPLSGKEPNS